MNDPTHDDGHRFNEYVIEWMIAVKEDNTTEARRIAEMPPEDAFPFMIALGHQAYVFLAAAVGHDPLDDLKLQLTEMKLYGMNTSDEP